LSAKTLGLEPPLPPFPVTLKSHNGFIDLRLSPQ